MTDQSDQPRRPSRAECIEAAGAVYAAILTNPDRRKALLAHRRRVLGERAPEEATRPNA